MSGGKAAVESNLARVARKESFSFFKCRRETLVSVVGINEIFSPPMMKEKSYGLKTKTTTTTTLSDLATDSKYEFADFIASISLFADRDTLLESAIVNSTPFKWKMKNDPEAANERETIIHFSLFSLINLKRKNRPRVHFFSLLFVLRVACLDRITLDLLWKLLKK